MTKGNRIKKLREELNLTQDELAKLLNTTKQTISKYEKGIVTNIPSDRIEELAKILHSTPEYILGWNNNEKLTVHGLEKDLVISYRKADELDKAIVRRTLKLDNDVTNQKNA